MKNYIKYINILLLVYSSLLAQNEFNFEYDYSQFRADSTSNILEVYYRINPTKLIVQNHNDAEKYVVSLIFKISDSLTSKVVWADTVNNIIDPSLLKQNDVFNNLIGVNRTIINEGKYNLWIGLKNDSISTPIAETEIYVKPFTSTLPSISDLQLANSIKRDTSSANSLFIKNTLKIIPNPSSSYTSDNPLLQFYCELYNLKGNNLELATYLLNQESKVIFSESKSLKSKNNSIVHIDQIHLLRYPSGVYNLQLMVADSTKDFAFISQKQFYFYNKLYVEESNESRLTESQFMTSVFIHLSEEECDDIFEKSKVIATASEKEQYNKLTTIEGKREFLFNFWKNRKSDSAVTANDAYSNYMALVAKINKRFREIGQEGYQTERGRVLLTNGEPDQIETYSNESNMKPYEIWYYNSIEGGVIFIFGDLSGFGNYVLLHSTKRGEVYDDSWVRRLRIN